MVEKHDFSAFILKGYAGTGKTSTMKAVVMALKEYNYQSVLLAPTGRAAKVLSKYSGKNAFTIHKKIYRMRSATEISAGFQLTENKHKRTLFIIDESSMISGSTHDGSGVHWARESILDDVIKYVYQHGNDNKILFIGDHAQLPPVGSDFSPALSKMMLETHYGLKVYEQTLTEVLRQNQDSGILMNATTLRNQIEQDALHWPSFKTKGYKDFYSITGEQLSDGIQYAYDQFGMEESLVICRSNKNANAYNQQIRARILFREEQISSGDYLMVVKNNYHWLTSDEGFIANGEIVKVLRVRREEELHGFHFAEATIQLLDNDVEKTLTVKVMLDTLTSESPALTQAEQKKLYDAVCLDYADIPNKSERALKIKADPYFNALQIKFAYAVTCHKAQGGQWSAVFIDQGYLVEEMLNADFLKWLYTAITRAKTQVFLVNFHQKFFPANQNN